MLALFFALMLGPSPVCSVRCYPRWPDEREECVYEEGCAKSCTESEWRVCKPRVVKLGRWEPVLNAEVSRWKGWGFP